MTLTSRVIQVKQMEMETEEIAYLKVSMNLVYLPYIYPLNCLNYPNTSGIGSLVYESIHPSRVGVENPIIPFLPQCHVYPRK